MVLRQTFNLQKRGFDSRRPHVYSQCADPNRKCPVELRECKHHGATEFAYYSRGNGERRWRCKRCVGEAVTRRKQAVKQLLAEESGGAAPFAATTGALSISPSTMWTRGPSRSG